MNINDIAGIALSALGVYLLIGLLFALVFVTRGVQKIDSTARDSGWGFRLLILPGCMAFWPCLMQRWRKGVDHPPCECSPHRRAACARAKAEEAS